MKKLLSTFFIAALLMNAFAGVGAAASETEFMPDTGDEVVVGKLGGDEIHPRSLVHPRPDAQTPTKVLDQLEFMDHK